MEYSAGWDHLIPNNSILNNIHNIYLILGLIILFYGGASILLMAKYFLNESILSMIVGVVFGPSMFDLADPKDFFGDEYHLVVLELSRIIVGVCCFNLGIQLPNKYMKKEVWDLVMMLGPIMTVMFLSVSFAAKLIFSFSWTDSFLVGACLTPTDPVLVSAVVSGPFAAKYVPARLRNLLLAESGANDALGFCFLYLPFYFSRISPPAYGLLLFLLKIMLYQIVLASVLGFFGGYYVSKILQVSESRNWIDKESMLVMLLALWLSCLGVMTRLGMDEIVGCLFLGVGLSWDGWFCKRIEGSHVMDWFDFLLNTLYFFLIGTLVSFEQFKEIGYWKLFVLALVIAFVKRVPWVFGLQKYINATHSGVDAFILGWFSPVGAGAILYSMVSYELGNDLGDKLVAIVVFEVFVGMLLQLLSMPLISGYFKLRHKRISSQSDVAEDQEEDCKDESTDFNDEFLVTEINTIVITSSNT